VSFLKINPKVDFVFRLLFGSERNKDLLISLINSVVEPDIKIVDVIIKNPFNLAERTEFKESILDIKAVDQDGTWYDVEMQLTPHSLYGRRAIYYLAKVYVDQLASGEDYSRLNPTIGIHFLDFRYFDDDRVVRHFVLKDAETNEAPEALSGLRLYFVEMAKFDKDWSELRSALDRWVAFLNRALELDNSRLPAGLQVDPAIAKAAAELDRIGASSEEREIYEGRVKALMIDQIQIKDAREEGLQEGGRNMLLHLMTRRMGDVPTDIASKLRMLTTPELDELGEALFDLKTYAEVEAWLTKH